MPYRKLTAAALLGAAASISTPAFAVTPCEELKSEIAQMLDAKQIKYTLEIVPTSTQVTPPAQVVGSCDGGKNKIVYKKQ